jgi:hypothetical protein
MNCNRRTMPLNGRYTRKCFQFLILPPWDKEKMGGSDLKTSSLGVWNIEQISSTNQVPLLRKRNVTTRLGLGILSRGGKRARECCEAS